MKTIALQLIAPDAKACSALGARILRIPEMKDTDTLPTAFGNRKSCLHKTPGMLRTMSGNGVSLTLSGIESKNYSAHYRLECVLKLSDWPADDEYILNCCSKHARTVRVLDV